jgi:hypothetical protein
LLVNPLFERLSEIAIRFSEARLEEFRIRSQVQSGSATSPRGSMSSLTAARSSQTERQPGSALPLR